MEVLYPENAWVTPCELFKPYYSYTVANYVMNQLETKAREAKRSHKKLQVIEIGPGTGTFADCFLEFFKYYDLEIYRNLEYTFVEISPQLATQCE
jgi:SAM-dependent MidA family methyltransferase